MICVALPRVSRRPDRGGFVVRLRCSWLPVTINNKSNISDEDDGNDCVHAKKNDGEEIPQRFHYHPRDLLPSGCAPLVGIRFPRL